MGRHRRWGRHICTRSGAAGSPGRQDHRAPCRCFHTRSPAPRRCGALPAGGAVAARRMRVGTARGQGRPEAFDFPGFTHYCRSDRHRRFGLGRKPIAKRMNRTLQAIKRKPRQWMHADKHETGRWLGQVPEGWLNCYAVPTKLHAREAAVDAGPPQEVAIGAPHMGTSGRTVSQAPAAPARSIRLLAPVVAVPLWNSAAACRLLGRQAHGSASSSSPARGPARGLPALPLRRPLRSAGSAARGPALSWPAASLLWIGPTLLRRASSARLAAFTWRPRRTPRGTAEISQPKFAISSIRAA